MDKDAEISVKKMPCDLDVVLDANEPNSFDKMA